MVTEEFVVAVQVGLKPIVTPSRIREKLEDLGLEEDTTGWSQYSCWLKQYKLKEQDCTVTLAVGGPIDPYMEGTGSQWLAQVLRNKKDVADGEDSDLVEEKSQQALRGLLGDVFEVDLS